MSFVKSIAACVILASNAAQAGPKIYVLPEPTAVLRPLQGHEAGLEATQTNCVSCHSVDYIAMQPPGKGKALWDSEVAKMVKVYHAIIDEADAKAISAYLAAAY